MIENFHHYIQSYTVITNDEFEEIASVCTIKKLRKKQYLLQEGDVWRYSAFICAGCLRRYWVDKNGLEHITNFAIENEWIGDCESLLEENPSKYNIDALENSRVLLIDKNDFERICKRIPAFNTLTHYVLRENVAALEKRLRATLSYSAEEKFENFKKHYPDFNNRIPQHMIASFLGISAETLSRIKNKAVTR